MGDEVPRSLRVLRRLEGLVAVEMCRGESDQCLMGKNPLMTDWL